ncbi:unnamed protein product [Phyllotreta striolata]|uniref:Integrin beta n=1 Tax=Phyllotreta striolata TaxID=444603 RepID=A0A9N9TMB9_PHYSR|nr:unnamed protein product [Phyllotreta striolata]
MNLCLLTLLLQCLLVHLANGQSSSECTSLDIQKICIDQESCDECLQAHVCCSWCYDENYNERRCNIQNNLKECDSRKIEIGAKSSLTFLKDHPFTVIKEEVNLDSQDIVQIRPQKIQLKLRKGVPVTFTFTYKPAENYPLDLYYLGDLSQSMSQNIEVFKSLGKDLPNHLTKLTKNYKLAYGSFVDKPGMPFYLTAPFFYDNPCSIELGNCEKGYLFKHRLDFTNNFTKFLEKVENSNLTANVDDLDGALDAILQILNCEDVIGFSKNSRKIILLPTDSLLHSAGDGVLVGAALKTTEHCMLDQNGEHSEPLKYDYPSLEQIDALIRQKKVNIIFAVKTETKLQYYMNMTKDSLKGFVYVAELEEQSKNILDLIKSGFYSFVEQVTFSINQTYAENLDIKFFADCENVNRFNQTSTCYHVKDKPVRFKVQITLKDIPLGKYNDTLYVEEKNINEKIELNIDYLESCKCQNYEYKDKIKCVHGFLKCDKCTCENGWSGTDCSEECSYDETSCRIFDENENTYSRICSNNGDCVCGKCKCDEAFIGEYCQYKCNGKRVGDTFQICGGPEKGTCFEGKCHCMTGYTGEDCSCSTSQQECLFSTMDKPCSGKGDCVCNKCTCRDDYTGQYCEKSKYGGNNTICDAYESAVRDALGNNGSKIIEKNGQTVEIIDESAANELSCSDDIPCTTMEYQGRIRCIFEYCYYGDQNYTIAARKICMMTAGFKTVVSGLSVLCAVIFLGLMAIAYYKFKIYRDDKLEYERFIAQNKNAVEMNPIYKSPVTHYDNPLRTKSD